MEIAVFGEYYSTNLGDPVILDSVIYMIRSIYKNANVKIIDMHGRDRIILANNNENNIKKYNKIKKPLILKTSKTFVNWVFKDKRRLHEYFEKSLENTDLLIIAGGQLIMNNNLIFPLRLHELVKIANDKKIPIIFNSCGVQNYSKKNFGTKLLEQSLNYDNVKIVTTRDDLKMLKKYIKSEDKIVDKSIDAAVWCNKAYNIEKNKNSNIVGLGIISPNMYQVYYERTKDKKYYLTKHELKQFWMDLILKLDDEKVEWKVFCNGAKSDYDFGYEILKDLNLNDKEINNKLVKRPLEAKELVKQISEFNVIISQRLHSHIIAASLGIPSIGIVWDEKVFDFAKAIGVEKYFFNLNNTSVNEVYEAYKMYKCNDNILNPDLYRNEAILYIKKMKELI